MSLRVGLALLKAELDKVWARPILEITVAFMATMAIFMVQPFTEIVDHSKFSIVFQSALAGSVSSTVASLLLPLVIMCGVLMALSFARDYESGLMLSILSVPVSRKMFFAVKFFAVVLPLALLSWILTTFFVGLTFYSSPWLVLQLSFYALPVTFLSLMFCGGIGVLVALLVKRSIPAVLTSLLANFFFWFLTNIDTLSSGGDSYANYLCLTPYKGALVFLNKLLGLAPKAISMTDTLEVTLSAGAFGVLAVFWACVLVVPMFVYFCRRFEICE
ncbi:MAG: ABC transporter permease [Candidatus Bathyarchaeota archaeon]|nr:ABC transporter permease [Candidatus Termiticorpusculum sp.]